MQSSFDGAELEFPLECHFRIVAENLDNMYFTIETVLLGLGITDPLEPAHVSGKGNYASFAFSTIVPSRLVMEHIDRELRAIVGVKMVM
ncbi:MAG: DUF493 family protein [Verrucomicrobiota bacterium]